MGGRSSRAGREKVERSYVEAKANIFLKNKNRFFLIPKSDKFDVLMTPHLAGPNPQ